MAAAVIASLALAPVALATSAGGGSELPARAFERWCASAADCTYAIHDEDLDTAALGTGEVEWIATDEPLTAAQRREIGGPTAHVPVLLGAIAVSVNIPGTPGHHVRLSGRTLGQIFSGDIVNWHDARIHRQNRHRAVGRGGPITLCVPAHASGTTWDMTEYLARVSPEFRRRVGGASSRPASWRAPRVVPVADVAVLGDCIRDRPGAIGFWAYDDALRHGETEDVIAVGEPRTVAHSRIGTPRDEHTRLVYRHPNERAMHAATVEAERELVAADGRYVFDLTATGAAGAYPITTVVWIVYRADRGLSPGARSTLRAMLSDAEQAELEGLGYGRLSPVVLRHARTVVAAAPRARAPEARAAEARPLGRPTSPIRPTRPIITNSPTGTDDPGTADDPVEATGTPAEQIAAAVASTQLMTLSDVTISSSTSPITASATLTTVHNPTPMTVAVSYTDSRNWSITINRGSAGSSYAPALGTSLNVNQLSGTISRVDGGLSYNLSVTGQVLGDGTFDMTATLSRDTGIQATAIVDDVVIGGMELESAVVTVSTASEAASVNGTLITSGGTFDAALSVQGSTASYTIALSASGADLEPSSSSFEVLSFSFSTTIVTTPSACTDVTEEFSGSVKIGNGTYTVSNGLIEFCGTTLEKFLFDVSFAHYVKWKKATDTATLKVGWAGTAGTYTSPKGDTYSYASGYFGNVSLKQERDFSKKYEGTTFNRTVKIGVGFGVAALTAADGTTTVWLGAGGAVEADRVSGALACDLYAAPSADFICGVVMRINPPWAGIYEYGWWTI